MRAFVEHQEVAFQIKSRRNASQWCSSTGRVGLRVRGNRRRGREFRTKYLWRLLLILKIIKILVLEVLKTLLVLL